jgi:hypothetical protein
VVFDPLLQVAFALWNQNRAWTIGGREIRLRPDFSAGLSSLDGPRFWPEGVRARRPGKQEDDTCADEEPG